MIFLVNHSARRLLSTTLLIATRTRIVLFVSHTLEDMIRRTLIGRDIQDLRVLEAMRQVPRQRFVSKSLQELAFCDRPLPIGSGQTISQPYIVAFMAQASDLTPSSQVLEIGTGSGYGAAILSRLGGHVFSVEVIPELAQSAQETLASLGYTNVSVRCSDGSYGWPEEQPFDAIVVTAAPPCIPPALLKQLKVGGKLVIPVGEGEHQSLQIVQRTPQGFEEKTAFAVRFVPMVGQIREER